MDSEFCVARCSKCSSWCHHVYSLALTCFDIRLTCRIFFFASAFQGFIVVTALELSEFFAFENDNLALELLQRRARSKPTNMSKSIWITDFHIDPYYFTPIRHLAECFGVIAGTACDVISCIMFMYVCIFLSFSPWPDGVFQLSKKKLFSTL